jgi:hypothetical protein
MSTFKEIGANFKKSLMKSFQGLKLAVFHKPVGTVRNSVHGLKEAVTFVKSNTSKAVPSLREGMGTPLHRHDDQFPLGDPSQDLAAKSHRESSQESRKPHGVDNHCVGSNDLELEGDISEGIRVKLSSQEKLSSSVETKNPLS